MICILNFVMCIGCGIYILDMETDDAGMINHVEDHAIILGKNEDLKNEKTEV